MFVCKSMTRLVLQKYDTWRIVEQPELVFNRVRFSETRTHAPISLVKQFCLRRCYGRGGGGQGGLNLPLLVPFNPSFCILPLVCGLHSEFYPWSAVCILPSVCFFPWSAVRSPQSSFYTDRICNCCERFVFDVNDL